MTGTLEKMMGNPNTSFRHNQSLIIPGLAGGPAAAKGINNKQNLYAVLFFVIIENDVISIDVNIIKVKQTKDNKYKYKKHIKTKNVVVGQKHSVKSLINDMLNGNFNRIQLPGLDFILGLIPGFGMGAVKAGGGMGAEIVSFPTQDLQGCLCPDCGIICFG